MNPSIIPPEVWLLIFQLLSTKEAITSSHGTRYLHAASELKRVRRQHQMDMFNLFATLPNEIWFIILQFLSIRELVFLSLSCQDFQSLAGHEIRQRLDINKLLSKYVADVDRFRSVMHSTGSLIVGDFTTAFFTGYDLPDCIEIFIDRAELMSNLRSWFKVFSEEDKISGNGKGEGLSIESDVARNVRIFKNSVTFV